MADRPDKRTRKEKLDVWKAQQRAAARARLPLSNAEMRGMFDMLSAQLPRRGCDHELTLVREWLATKGLPIDPVEAWLHENGGHCDCEALANAEQNWLDAIYDVDW